MSTAAPFKAVGLGNGFASCLTRITGEEKHELVPGADPDLKTTMKTYWNIKKVSWGGAEYETTGTPADLAAAPKGNVGSDTENKGGHAVGNQEFYEVSIGMPEIFVKDNEEYYIHALSMKYYASDDYGDNFIEVDYGSTYKYLSDTDNQGYVCEPLMFTDGTNFGPSGSQTSTWEVEVGKVSSQTTTTYSLETISEIPFVKRVKHTFGGMSSDGCTNPSNLSEPATKPQLTFHTYTS